MREKRKLGEASTMERERDERHVNERENLIFRIKY